MGCQVLEIAEKMLADNGIRQSDFTQGVGRITTIPLING
jgi:hypothetical protein